MINGLVLMCNPLQVLHLQHLSKRRLVVEQMIQGLAERENQVIESIWFDDMPQSLQSLIQSVPELKDLAGSSSSLLEVTGDVRDLPNVNSYR